ESFPDDTLFDERCLISLTDPARATTVFYLVVSRVDEEIELGRLRPWLTERMLERPWLAIHAFGQQAAAGQGDLRVGPSPRPRTLLRTGAALALRAAQPGELVDRARLPGCRSLASSYISGFEPDRVRSGRLLPSPWAPNCWLSRPGA